ncbi:MAG: hypothetical protein GAK45_00866 [Pseudomonas citronellolis]|nr:MAG: hypothetical protein GAK45_00866 [Pseudomonas citronellolis]
MLTERFPILHEGEVPRYELADWSLRLHGALSRPLELRFDDLLQLPQREVRCDIHCVTRWSKFDTRWRGVHLGDQPLTPQHGWPLRLLVAGRYF